MDPTYTTYSFDNGTTTVILNPSMDGEYLFHEGNLAAEMLMAVCQESNFGIPIRIDIPEDVHIEQGEENIDEDPQVHTLDLNLIEPEETSLQQQMNNVISIPQQTNTQVSTKKMNGVLKGGVRKRRSKPPDPYHDLLSQIRRDTNKVHQTFQKQGDRICRLFGELIDILNK